jgi:hypothetical protein
VHSRASPAVDKGTRERAPAPAVGPQLVFTLLLQHGGPISCSGWVDSPLGSLRACSLSATVYLLLLRAEAALPWHAGALGYMSFGGAKGKKHLMMVGVTATAALTG